MTEALDILKYLLPSLVVFATAYTLIRSLLSRDLEKQKLEVFLNNQKQITPIRLQAYERLVLFLERINPESLLVRINESGMSNQELQQSLLAAIRQEYEHNLSQQLYVSSSTWELTRNAKESLIQNINMAARELTPQNSSLELSRAILERHMENSLPATKQALDVLREEVKNLF